VGDLDVELPDSRVREVAELSSVFAAMSGELRASLQHQAEIEEERRMFIGAMAHDVFISHSSQDKTIADAVCAALENEAVRTWIAPRDVQPGRSFAGEITRAIQHSKVMVLIFSKHSNASQQVLREVQHAAQRAGSGRVHWLIS